MQVKDLKLILDSLPGDSEVFFGEPPFGHLYDSKEHSVVSISGNCHGKSAIVFWTYPILKEVVQEGCKLDFEERNNILMKSGLKEFWDTGILLRCLNCKESIMDITLREHQMTREETKYYKVGLPFPWKVYCPNCGCKDFFLPEWNIPSSRHEKLISSRHPDTP